MTSTWRQEYKNNISSLTLVVCIFWVVISCKNILAFYGENVNQKEQLHHAPFEAQYLEAFMDITGTFFEDSKVKLRSSDLLEKNLEIFTRGTKPEQLIIDCFGQMMPHVWFRLVPSDGKI